MSETEVEIASSEHRADVYLMGRFIGTMSVWDQIDLVDFVHYGFQPAPDVELPAGDLCINFTSGCGYYVDEKGIETLVIDLVPLLAKLPLDPKAKMEA